MTTRRLRPLLLVPVIALVLTACQGSEVARSIQLTNQAREAAGLAVVIHNPTLQAKAQNWANLLAAHGSLVHSNLAEDAGSGWRALGENLAKAGSIEEAQRLFMDSPAHRSTQLSSRYSQIGVGVASNGGTYYVVHVFGG
ncbi:MAG: CAP domain-containing protein [Microthrixaceae bacterium]|nr:CAP domain-containing protein [Microthrixaceae bacterium]